MIRPMWHDILHDYLPGFLMIAFFVTLYWLIFRRSKWPKLARLYPYDPSNAEHAKVKCDLFASYSVRLDDFVGRSCIRVGESSAYLVLKPTLLSRMLGMKSVCIPKDKIVKKRKNLYRIKGDGGSFSLEVHQ